MVSLLGILGYSRQREARNPLGSFSSLWNSMTHVPICIRQQVELTVIIPPIDSRNSILEANMWNIILPTSQLVHFLSSLPNSSQDRTSGSEKEHYPQIEIMNKQQQTNQIS